MKILLSIAATSLIVSAHADTFVYSQSYSETITGYGSVKVLKWKGYLIFDEQGGFIQIDTNPKAKTYQVHDYSTNSWNFYYPQIGAGSDMVLAFQPSADYGIIYAKGKAAPTTVGLDTRTIAKTLTLGGAFTLVDGSNDVLHEYKGTLVLDTADLTTVNVAYPGVQSALGYLKIKLGGSGYIELL